ncbi:MAG: lipoate--protein ligase family protein [Veillonellaceae bacterium]|jgi:lipoate-protein ligase A|nr:lipoate--protein ligase family protein [Veillonellaceae bacterium]
MTKWRLVNSGVGTAAQNMAVDEAILKAHAAGEVPPTLRFYGWHPAAVSLGYFQSADAEIDIAACRANGIDLVRRLTGGRAVLHDMELTYSLVISENDPLIPPTITASYRYFSQGLIAGLQKMGVKAQMSMPREAYSQSKRRHASAACFDASSHYEITFAGRKLIGSAQVRKDGVIMQHGSILLTFEPAILVSLLNLPSAEKRNSLQKVLADRVISVSEIMGRDVDWEETYLAMSSSFGPALGIDVISGELTSSEVAAANELIATKYSQDSWNLMR